MPDMGSLLGMAMEMQQQMLAAQEAANEAVVEGQAGGGVVRIAVNGAYEFQSVTIDPEAVDPDDVEMLQDLVLAAIHDAVARVHELTASANPLAGLDLGAVDLGGLDLGGLFGMDGAGGVVDVEEATNAPPELPASPDDPAPS
jgi:DNA-binding YbaB/EbfC family protein